MPEPTRIPPGDLQRRVWEQHPKADLFEIIGRWADSSFRGITFNTSRRTWWWAAVDGTIAPEPLPTRSDAAVALDEHTAQADRAERRKATYSVESGQPDGYPVWHVVRTKGTNIREVAVYTEQSSADSVAIALNYAAPYED